MTFKINIKIWNLGLDTFNLSISGSDSNGSDVMCTSYRHWDQVICVPM